MASEDELARRQRRAADTRRWRSRKRRAVRLYEIEAGPDQVELAIRFGGLSRSRTDDQIAVNTALGKLLRRAISALLREQKNL